jgi:hypothetical protein
MQGIYHLEYIAELINVGTGLRLDTSLGVPPDPVVKVIQIPHRRDVFENAYGSKTDCVEDALRGMMVIHDATPGTGDEIIFEMAVSIFYFSAHALSSFVLGVRCWTGSCMNVQSGHEKGRSMSFRRLPGITRDNADFAGSLFP